MDAQSHMAQKKGEYGGGASLPLTLVSHSPEFLKFLRSPRINSKEPIPPIPAGCVAWQWRAGTAILFLLGSLSPTDCLKIPAQVAGGHTVPGGGGGGQREGLKFLGLNF